MQLVAHMAHKDLAPVPEGTSTCILKPAKIALWYNTDNCTLGKSMQWRTQGAHTSPASCRGSCAHSHSPGLFAPCAAASQYTCSCYCYCCCCDWRCLLLLLLDAAAATAVAAAAASLLLLFRTGPGPACSCRCHCSG